MNALAEDVPRAKTSGDGVAEGFLSESEPEEEDAEFQSATVGFAESLAFDHVKSSRDGAEAATAFLRDQRRMLNTQMEHLHEQRVLVISRLKARRIGEWFKVCFQVFTALAASCIGLGLAVMILDAFNSKSVIVEPFDAPASLAPNGLTGKVIAGDVLDGLTRIQAATRATATKRHLANAWSGDIKVEVPETGVSIGEIDRLLHQRFGHDEHIQGDLRLADGGQLSLTVRGDGVLPKSFTGPVADLDKLTVQAAEYIYGESEPFLFATYLIGNSRNQDALGFLPGAYARGSEADRSELANSWANAYLGLGRNAEAVAKYRLAIGLKPRMWKTWDNLMAALILSEREEDAWKAGAAMRALAAKSPKNERPDRKFYVNFLQLTQDLPEALAENLEDSKLNAGAGAGTTIDGPALADNYARMHDWHNAELFLTASDPDDPTTKAEALLLPAYRALDAGNAQAAVAPLEAFYKAWLADTDLQSTFNDQACMVGLVYAMTGRAAEAAPVFARLGRRLACMADRADGLDYVGDIAGADRAYAEAVALAPDLPTAWYHRGMAFARRGDVARAEANFAAAHARGPHWADPLKAWGDSLALRGRWRDALAKYEEAVAYAPNWHELLLARDVARRRAK